MKVIELKSAINDVAVTIVPENISSIKKVNNNAFVFMCGGEQILIDMPYDTFIQLIKSYKR